MPKAQTNVAAGEPCGAQLTLEHFDLCVIGTARTRQHDMVADCLHNVLKRSGMYSDRERPVPWLVQPGGDASKEEPRMDVTLLGGVPPR